MKIEGMDRVLRNLNREIEKIKEGSIKGLILAARLILNDADKKQPKIPVRTGYLRSSRFITPTKSKTKPYVTFGYKANYAAFVHEMLGAKFRRKGAGAKFLEMSIKRNQAKIIEIVRNNAKIK